MSLSEAGLEKETEIEFAYFKFWRFCLGIGVSNVNKFSLSMGLEVEWKRVVALSVSLLWVQIALVLSIK
jgi:hypothetical protein